jgi:hypothetical protein
MRFAFSSSILRLARGVLLTAPILVQTTYVFRQQVEIWPFSNFPMFSRLFLSTNHSGYVVYGVTADGKEIELSNPNYWLPFDSDRQRAAIRRSLQKSGTQADRDEDLRKFLSNLLELYEARRLSGKHHGEKIVRLRLYRVSWNWTQGIDNIQIGKALVFTP